MAPRTSNIAPVTLGGVRGGFACTVASSVRTSGPWTRAEERKVEGRGRSPQRRIERRCPLGTSRCITHGVVSALRRSVQLSSYPFPASQKPPFRHLAHTTPSAQAAPVAQPSSGASTHPSSIPVNVSYRFDVFVKATARKLNGTKWKRRERQRREECRGEPRGPWSLDDNVHQRRRLGHLKYHPLRPARQ